jgi:5'-3' exonuclease
MHIRLIDAVSLIAAQPQQDGEVAIRFLMAALVQGIRRYRQAEPDAMHMVLWDTRANRRVAVHSSYRGPRTQSADVQRIAAACDAHREVLSSAVAFLPVVQLSHPDMEARDLAYAVSKELSAQGHFITLTSADSAWLQCVRSRVSVESVRKGAFSVDEYTFKKQTGCASGQMFAEVRALAGVPADGVQGIAGFSEVQAKALLTQFGTLAAFWKAADDPFFMHFDLLPAALPEARALVLRNRALVDLASAPAPDTALASMACGEFSDIDLYERLLDLELMSLCETFPMLTKPFAKGITKEQAALATRVVRNMSKSYA